MKTIWIVTDNSDIGQLLSVLNKSYAVCVIGKEFPDGVPDLLLLTGLSVLTAFQQRISAVPERFSGVPLMCFSDDSGKAGLLSFDDARRMMCRFMPGDNGKLLSSIETVLSYDKEMRLGDEPQLSEFQSDIRRSYLESQNGAIQVTYDSFASIYHFVEKLAERSGQCVQTLLLTLVPKKNAVISKSILQSAMQILYNAVHITLRKNDVLTGCSSSQILVLLMDADDDGGHMAVNRIINTFLGLYDYPLFDLHYDIRPIDVNNPRK